MPLPIDPNIRPQALQVTATAAASAQTAFTTPYRGRAVTPLYLSSVVLSNSTASSRVQMHVAVLYDGATLGDQVPFMSPILQAGDAAFWEGALELRDGDLVVAWADNASRGNMSFEIGRRSRGRLR